MKEFLIINVHFRFYFYFFGLKHTSLIHKAEQLQGKEKGKKEKHKIKELIFCIVVAA